MDSFVVGDLGEVENVGEYIEEEASSVLLEDGYTFVPTTPPSEDHMLARQPSSNSQLFKGPTKGYTSSVSDNDLSTTEDLEFKAKYKKVKKEFLVTVEMHEYLENELRVHQRELKRLKEDKFFLLERLLLYEKPPPDSPESGEGSDSDNEEDNARKLKASSEVTFSSAFSKIKSLSTGRKNKRSRTRGAEDVFESPNDSLGTFEDDPAGLTSSFSFQTQEDSD